jgi:hypothetical protein
MSTDPALRSRFEAVVLRLEAVASKFDAIYGMPSPSVGRSGGGVAERIEAATAKGTRSFGETHAAQASNTSIVLVF